MTTGGESRAARGHDPVNPWHALLLRPVRSGDGIASDARLESTARRRLVSADGLEVHLEPQGSPGLGVEPRVRGQPLLRLEVLQSRERARPDHPVDRAVIDAAR